MPGQGAVDHHVDGMLDPALVHHVIDRDVPGDQRQAGAGRAKSAHYWGIERRPPPAGILVNVVHATAPAAAPLVNHIAGAVCGLSPGLLHDPKLPQSFGRWLIDRGGMIVALLHDEIVWVWDRHRHHSSL